MITVGKKDSFVSEEANDRGPDARYFIHELGQKYPIARMRMQTAEIIL